MSADTRPMTLPIVESVARHIATRMHEPNPNAWRMNLRVATYALEASHHAELVEALRKAAPFVGHVAVHDPEAIVAGSRAGELCDEIDALLAKLGGDS